MLKYRRIRELNGEMIAYLKQNSSVWMGLICTERKRMRTTEDEPNLTFDIKTLKQIKTSNGINYDFLKTVEFYDKRIVWYKIRIPVVKAYYEKIQSIFKYKNFCFIYFLKIYLTFGFELFHDFLRIIQKSFD
jgi:hypothetical protein